MIVVCTTKRLAPEQGIVPSAAKSEAVVQVWRASFPGRRLVEPKPVEPIPIRGMDMRTTLYASFATAIMLSSLLLLTGCGGSEDAPQADGPYRAVFTCVHNGQFYNVRGCFQDSGIKITTPGGSRIHDSSRFLRAGDSVEYTLHEGTRIQARNSHEVLTLRIRVYDGQNELVYQGGAGENDIIDFSR